MGNQSKIDMDKLITFSTDLIQVLKNNRDVTNLIQSHQSANTLQSNCKADANATSKSLAEYEEKLSECRKRIDEAKKEAIADSEISGLESELEEEIRQEALLEEELRVVNEQIADLECQRIDIEDKKKVLRKCDKDELREERKLSMYASVTNIIPTFHDKTNISGYIAERDRRVFEMFEFVPADSSPFEICNSLWKMIDM